MLNSLRRIVSRHPLAGELTLVFAIKMTLIVLAGIFLFGSDHRVPVDAHVIADRLFD